MTKQLFDRFETLLTLRYFHHVWVLQEVALARRLILHVNGSQARLFKEVVSRLRTGYGGAKVELPASLRTLSHEEPARNLVEALKISITCSSSDQRDKVYGVLSLLPLNERIVIPVDYGLNADQVFANAVTACINATQSLDVLRFASLDDCEANPSHARNFTITEFNRYLRWVVPGWRTPYYRLTSYQNNFLKAEQTMCVQVNAGQILPA